MSRTLPRLLSTVAAVLFALLVTVTTAGAQSSTLTSGIEGRVTDDSGGALPGVAVTIKSPALQTPQLETVSDAAGRYRFAGLPGGIYTLPSSSPASQNVTRESLRVDANFVATIDARMAIGQLEETITVTGDVAGRRRPQHDRRRRTSRRRRRDPADVAQLRGHRQARARDARLTASPTSAATRPAAAAARWSTTDRATAARR